MKLPRYKQLHRRLKNDILSGYYAEGSLLPSENTLSVEHNMNRMMVRQALSVLEQEGYIARRQGKGSIVCAPKPSLGLLSFRGFSDVVEETEHLATSQFINEPYHADWGEDFFFELTEEEQQAGCIVIERLRQVDHQPVMLENTYLPDIDIPDFSQKDWVQGSLFRTLYQHYQIEMISVDQILRAISAEDMIAKQLLLDEKRPIVHIYRKYISNRENYYVYSSLYCNTQQYAISNLIK